MVYIFGNQSGSCNLVLIYVIAVINEVVMRSSDVEFITVAKLCVTVVCATALLTFIFISNDDDSIIKTSRIKIGELDLMVLGIKAPLNINRCDQQANEFQLSIFYMFLFINL